MKGIYLAAFRAEHKDFDIVYQDINGQRDIGGDMMNVDLGLGVYHLPQRQDFLNHGFVIKYDDMSDCSHQGGYNVHVVIDYFLNIIHKTVDRSFF